MKNKFPNSNYDYSLVKYKNALTKITIICKIGNHGNFKIQPSSLLNGHGCSKCSNKYRHTPEEWIQKAIQTHGDKYNYEKAVYISHYIKVKIYCKKKNHGFFWQNPYSHIKGSNCPSCSNRGYSKQQIQWLKYLSVHREIQHAETENEEYSVPNTFYSADGYEAKTNTIFEYHGSFWHGNPNIHNPNDVNPVTKKKFGQLFKNTIKKEILLRNLGYNYKCIWDVDWIKGVNAVITLQKLWKNKK